MTQLYCVVYREEKDLIEFHLFKHDWSDSSVGNFPIKLNFHRHNAVIFRIIRGINKSYKAS